MALVVQRDARFPENPLRYVFSPAVRILSTRHPLVSPRYAIYESEGILRLVRNTSEEHVETSQKANARRFDETSVDLSYARF